MLNPTIDGAIAHFNKGIKKLDAVIEASHKKASNARVEIARLGVDMKDAQETAERASRIKSKLESLIS